MTRRITRDAIYRCRHFSAGVVVDFRKHNLLCQPGSTARNVVRAPNYLIVLELT